MKALNTLIIFLLSVYLCSCDEELNPPSFDISTAKEKLLVGDWTYEYILMDDDTIRALTQQGEPQTTGIIESVNLLYRKYDKNHNYHFRWEEIFVFAPQKEYGAGVNYQPNLGYWHLSQDEITLIHNKGTTYEKRFEILELTKTKLILKLIGDRTSYVTDGDGEVIKTITGSWTEVFVARN